MNITPSLPLALRASKVNPQERAAGVLMVESRPSILFVHDPGLGRVQPQPDLGHPVPDRHHQRLCLGFGGDVHHGIICELLEVDPRMVPGHPPVERVVHEG